MPQFGMVACPALEPRRRHPEMIEARFSRHYPIRSACDWIPSAPQWRYWSWTELNGQHRIDQRSGSTGACYSERRHPFGSRHVLRLNETLPTESTSGTLCDIHSDKLQEKLVKHPRGSS